MKVVELEYLFPYSINFLLKRFNTASGLSEWFADDVFVNGDIFTFKWKDYETKAKKIFNGKNKIKLIWLDNENTYTEFTFNRNKLSKDTYLIIKDVVEDDEDEEEIKLFWDNLIKTLKFKLGISD